MTHADHQGELVVSVLPSPLETENKLRQEPAGSSIVSYIERIFHFNRTTIPMPYSPNRESPVKARRASCAAFVSSRRSSSEVPVLAQQRLHWVLFGLDRMASRTTICS